MTAAVDRLTTALAAKYAIDREIGAGGMARVYLAEDVKHHRKVAVKVFRPELAAVLGPERFLREIELAAGLSHPHILPLHDSGEVDGFLYYVMPYVEGESLRDRLVREKQLGVDDALRITGEVADALQYAHEHDVVHRDVKPENVLLTGRHALIADFGIGKALSAAGAEQLTQTGISVGTPWYMSPEQAAGDGELDGRSDLYSLGCVLYEMLAGEPPYTGPSPQAIMAKRVTDPVPSIRRLRDTVPDFVDAAITKSLAKVPADRFADSAQFAAALSRAAPAPADESAALLPTLVDTLADRTPFVGRDAERVELRRRLDELEQGRGGLVLIGGEPGVGKTRLAEQFLAEARERNVLCLVGHCYEGEGSAPYLPFVEGLEYVARVVPKAAFREALGDAAPEIARMMPELRRIFPDIPPALELPPEQQRRYLFNCYQEFAERATRVAPVVTLLDDLHWADESTLLLLEHLAQSLSTTRTLFIVTYRDVELDVGRPFAKTLETLTRQRLGHRIVLRRFSEETVGDLLQSLGGEAPPPDLVQVVFHETEGNPFFVEEVFQHLSEQGRLFDAEGRWRTDLSIDELEVPEGVRLVIGRRLERLNDTTRKMLAAGAVIGRRFSLTLIEALGDVQGDELFDAIEEAERVRLVRPTATGRETQYTFVHELIRQTLVGALSLPRRQRMHLRIADAIERTYPSGLEQHAPDLAFHLYQSGAAADPTKTIHYLILAGDQALAGSGYEEALGHCDTALGLEELSDPRQQADLWYKRGMALRSLGRWKEALQSWEQALPHYEEINERHTVAELCLNMAVLSAWQDQGEAAVSLARRGLAAVGEQRNAVHGRLLGVAGLALGLTGDYEEAVASLTEAETVAEAISEASVLGEILHYWAFLSWNHGKIRDMVEFGRRAVEALRSTGEQWLLTDAYGLVQTGLGYMGQLDEVSTDVAGGRPLAERIGNVGAVVFYDNAKFLVEWCRTADLDAFEAHAMHVTETWGRAGPWSILGLLFQGITHCLRGDWDQAVELSAERVDDLPEVYAGHFWGNLLEAKAYLGHPDAVDLFEDKKHLLPRAGEPHFNGAWAFALYAVEGLVLLGRRQEAAGLYDVVVEALDDGWKVLLSRFIPVTAGVAAAAGGKWDLAEEHFQDALKQAHEIPHRLGQVDGRRWYARMLIDRGGSGDVEKARELMTEAIAGYRELGMAGHLKLAEEMLGEAGA